MFKVKALKNCGLIKRNYIYTVFYEGKFFYEIFVNDLVINEYGRGTVCYPKQYFTKTRQPGENW